MGERKSDGRTAVERKSALELVVTRTFDAPVRLVFDAWTKPDLFKLWWAPKSMGVPLLSCEIIVTRTTFDQIVTASTKSDVVP